jgi:hypothetical protein
VCTEIYNEGDRAPRLLPCFHTFCSACLKKIFVKYFAFGTQNHITSIGVKPFCVNFTTFCA